MLSLCEPSRVTEDLYRLAKVHNPDASIETVDELRRSYLAFIAERQPAVPVNFGDDVFVLDRDVQDRLAAAFSKGALNDLNQEDVVGESYEPDILKRRTAMVGEALARLLGLDEAFSSVFDLVVHSIFVRPSKPAKMTHGSHGGSSSASIGAIWLAVGDKIGQLDLIEMLVHELTHHLMFIDELNRPQFNYDLIKRREYFALSAILRRQRPLDKVVHSIVVGASLIDARERFLNNRDRTVVHPATPELKAHTYAAITSVMELPNVADLVTPHTLNLLHECVQFCREPEYVN